MSMEPRDSNIAYEAQIKHILPFTAQYVLSFERGLCQAVDYYGLNKKRKLLPIEIFTAAIIDFIITYLIKKNSLLFFCDIKIQIHNRLTTDRDKYYRWT